MTDTSRALTETTPWRVGDPHQKGRHKCTVYPIHDSVNLIFCEIAGFTPMDAERRANLIVGAINALAKETKEGVVT